MDFKNWQQDTIKGTLSETLTRRTVFDKTWSDKTFNIAKNPKYDGYQTGLASVVYKLFDKKISDSGIENEYISNQESAEKLHKPVIRKFKKREVHPPFVDNTWAADLANMQLKSKFDQRMCIILCVIDIFSNMHGLFLWKIKK